jgi:hypothetical protein
MDPYVPRPGARSGARPPHLKNRTTCVRAGGRALASFLPAREMPLHSGGLRSIFVVPAD